MSRSLANVRTLRDKQGFVEHLDFDDYKAVQAINMSVACHMAQSPLHCKTAFERSYDADTDSMQWGRAVHIAAFEPATFEARVWEAEGRRTPKLKAEAEEAGAELLKPGNKQFCYHAAVAAAYRLSQLGELQPFIRSGQAELSGFTVVEGMQCKFRLDWLSAGDPVIIDLKTTRSLESFAFSRDFYRLRYNVKLGIYRAFCAELLEVRPDDIPVYLLLIENHSPFDCFMAPRYGGQAIPIDRAILDRGARVGMEWIRGIRRCLDAGEWPGMAAEPEWDLHTPSWEMDDEFTEDLPDA